jgi:AraC-like DNA-binding protein
MTTETLRPLIEAVRALERSALRNISNQQLILMMAASSSRELQRDQSPPAIRISPHKIQGPRLEEARARGVSVTAAHWPLDNLIETRQPILCCVIEGRASLPMGQYRLQVPAENFVFIPALVPHPDGSQPHLENASEVEYCDLFWLYRWKGGLICHLCHSRGARHFNFEASENCFLTGSQSILYFDMLALELEAAATSPPLSTSSPINAAHYVLLALLAAVQRDLEAGNYISSVTSEEKHLLPTSKTPISAIDNYGAIFNVQNYMIFHIDQPLSLNDMAHKAAMSRAQFTRLFRQVSGCSFLEYLTKARIERAKQFLKESDLPIPLIAQAVGLRASQLRNLFSHHLNTTPHKFRHQQQTRTPVKRQRRKGVTTKTDKLQ